MPKTTVQPSASIGHFAINADDVAKARHFYEQVFGWRFEAWGPPDFFMISTSSGDEPGIRGSLQKRRELVPGVRMTGYECTIAVADVSVVATAVVENGGKLVLPRTFIPTVGHIIFFQDSDGNLVGACQPDQTASDD